MDLSFGHLDLLPYLARHLALALLHFGFGIVSIRYAARRGWFRYWDLPTPSMKQTIGLMVLITVLL